MKNQQVKKKELEFLLEGRDATQPTIFSLQDWIKQENIPDLEELTVKTSPPKEEEMGVEPVSILAVVLGAEAVVQLVRSIHVWIKTSRPKVKMKIIVNSKTIEIEAENLPDTQSFVDRVLAIFEQSSV